MTKQEKQQDIDKTDKIVELLLDEIDEDMVFARNAMILYPFIHNATISHGKAVEILGVHKTDLIEFYDSMGIPYLDQSEEELLADLATMDRRESEAIVYADENKANLCSWMRSLDEGVVASMMPC